MNDQKIKNILKIVISSLVYYSGLFFFLNRFIKRKGLIIFNYHNFNTFTNDYWKNGDLFETNYQKNFEKQIKFIKKTIGFAVPKFIDRQLIESDLKALITFDDGYQDNFEVAFPILKKYNVSAIFFIPTDFIGTNNLLWHDKIKLWGIENGYSKRKIKKILKSINNGKIKMFQYLMRTNPRNIYKIPLMMNWDSLREIADNGFGIAAHTKSHIPLNYLNENEEFMEIEGSIDTLRENLFQYTDFFSVPNGKYSENTTNIFEKLHIKYCFSITPGINNNHVNRFFLKRNALLPSDPISVVALKLLKIKLT